MTERVRWGILGVAKIVRSEIIPAFRSTRHAVLTAIASRDPERASAAAREAGIANIFNSYDALLADPAIDAVYIPLPNHLHVAWTVKALASGKHVLCEKPIALDAVEAELIKEAALRHGRSVAEAFMVRYHPQWRLLRRRLDQAAIGPIRVIQGYFFYDNRDPGNIRNKREAGGGGLYDIGCYPILLARDLFAAEPLRAIGHFDRDPIFGIDRLTGGMVEFPGGRLLQFTCGTQMARSQGMILHGEHGRIEVRTPFNPGRSGPPARLLFDDCRDLYGGGATIEEVAPADCYALQIDDVSQAIRNNQTSIAGIDDAVANMRVIDAVFASERSGGWVAV